MSSAPIGFSAAPAPLGEMVTVLLPVYDDWVAAGEVLRRLDAAFAHRSETLEILFVDDGSPEARPADFGRGPYARLGRVEVLRLKRNLGHQRALAVGLCHLADKARPAVVVVMDSDGEDEPADAVRLVERLRREPAAPTIVFAERTRRSESFSFRVGYLGYRVIHRLLTGRNIRFGNFSAVPGASLAAITTEPSLWNHYAASVAARFPFTTIPSHRGRRVAGVSRLNYVGLITHGLSALSCYNELIGVRLLLFTCVLFALSIGGFAAILFLRLATTLPLPGWSSLFAGILVVVALQIVTLASNFTMQMIGTRSAQPFLPIRDYSWYVDNLTPLHPEKT